MTEIRRSPMTHFMLQVWREPVDEQRAEWRGKIHHLPSGDARYFREWTALVEFLEHTLSQVTGVPTPLPETPMEA